ncbi:caspase-9 isoform X2 [Nerophis lumbriciformis]|uniref:caspase-9 isoform X2 n=1 Tax=Nerophis lumbriciformis TaxID=546530 RepID=UPI002ADF5764|nr:caspase-9-like isoform X2 [Nerophis lumbriciformis]
MEESHKKVLQRYRINIVTGLEPTSLYDRLLEKGVFTQDMIDKIKSKETRRDQARQLVKDLVTRGRRAFPLFLESLHESDQHSLADLLQSNAPAVQGSTSNILVRPVVRTLPLSSSVDFQKQMKATITTVHPIQTPTLSPEREMLQSQTQARARMHGRTRRDSLQSYKMDTSPCGHCLIINNVEFEPQSKLSRRLGSNIDCDKMERRFKAMNFMVEVRTNLKQRVSHNRFPGAVYGVDGQYVPVQSITNYLNGKFCPSLQGKPKLFFIQACGGEEKDRGFEVPDEFEPCNSGEDDQTDAIPTSSSSDSLSMSDEPDARATLPTPSDILVSYSTFPGYVSWRDTQSGSWYIETLDRILEENAAAHDLGTMLTMVNNQVSQNSAKGYKQIPSYFNSLRKHLHFQTLR